MLLEAEEEQPGWTLAGWWRKCTVFFSFVSFTRRIFSSSSSHIERELRLSLSLSSASSMVLLWVFPSFLYRYKEEQKQERERWRFFSLPLFLLCCCLCDPDDGCNDNGNISGSDDVDSSTPPHKINTERFFLLAKIFSLTLNYSLILKGFERMQLFCFFIGY